MGNVIYAQQKFTDKKNSEYLKIFNEKIKIVQDWFNDHWPHADLKIDVVFSRNVAEPLEIKREIVYRTLNDTKATIQNTVTINRHTWINPYYMEDVFNSFVDEQIKAILGVMKLRNNKYDRRRELIEDKSKELPTHAE